MNYLASHLSKTFLVIAAIFFAASSQSALAQSVPPLGAAESFAVLGGTAVTATGNAVISGNVGVSPGSAVTGFPPAVVVNGQIYTGVGSLAGPAQSSARNAFNNLAGQPCLPANNLTGKILGQTPGAIVLTPGVYCFDTSAQLNAILTLNDGGDPNAIYVFQVGTTLTTASSSQVIMTSGGRGTNVYWQVGTSATIGTSTSFRGNIIADTSITLTTSATTTGRVFALDGAATIDSTSIDAVPSGIEFSAATYPVNEGDTHVTLTVTRPSKIGPASVRFTTSDTAGAQNCNVLSGVASSRCDYEIRIKTIRFADGEDSKDISVFMIDDSYMENLETFNVSLSNPTGASLGAQSAAVVTITDNLTPSGVNPIDTTSFFVHVDYLDFLNRLEDAPGFAFWTNEINLCGANQQCIDDKRTNVSAAFYLSIEFQNTGFLVERIYKTAYGDGTGTSTLSGSPQTLSVPVVRLLEFLPDTQEIGEGVIVNQAGWETVLENNKQALTADFVLRSRFTTAFPTTMTNMDFVNALNANAGNPLSTSERNQLVADLTGGAKNRAQVLRAVAEDSDLISAEFNRAFVLMQYFGYMRRNPDDAQDTDHTGYDFWLTKLNQFNGNYLNAEMVKAFIISGEYRQRFGQ